MDIERKIRHTLPVYLKPVRRSPIKSYQSDGILRVCNVRIDCPDVGRRLAGQGSRVGHLTQPRQRK